MGHKDVFCVKLTGAQVHDGKVAQEMLCLLNKQSIDRLVADKAYDDEKLRFWLKSEGIHTEIPGRKNRKLMPRCDKTVYRWRHRIENLFCRLKENRRLAMRFDKLDVTLMGFIALALIKLEVC